jgi:hypothetical protein
MPVHLVKQEQMGSKVLQVSKALLDQLVKPGTLALKVLLEIVAPLARTVSLEAKDLWVTRDQRVLLVALGRLVKMGQQERKVTRVQPVTKVQLELLEQLELRDSKDPLEPQEPQDLKASPDQVDPLDHRALKDQREIQVKRDQTGIQAILDHRDSKVQQVSQGQQDPQEIEDRLGQVVHLVKEVRLDLLVPEGILVQLDPPEIQGHLDQLDCLDHLERQDPLDRLVLLETKAVPAHLGLLGHLELGDQSALLDKTGHLVPQETRAQQETPDSKEAQAPKDLLDRRERRDNQVLRGIEAKRVHPAIKVHQDQQDHRVPLAMLVRRVPLDLQDNLGH